MVKILYGYLGRMLSRDPVKNGQNPYLYGENDPVNRVDPTGAVKGALLGTGAGLLSMGAEFVSGTAGSALGQWIRGGKVDLGKSLVDGLTNVATGAIYGNKELKNLGNAFVRGAGAGQPDPPSII